MGSTVNVAHPAAHRKQFAAQPELFSRVLVPVLMCLNHVWFDGRLGMPPKASASFWILFRA